MRPSRDRAATWTAAACAVFLSWIAASASSCRKSEGDRSNPPQTNAAAQSARVPSVAELMQQLRDTRPQPTLEVRHVAGPATGVVLAAFSNGLVVLSANLRRGGPPFRCIAAPAGSVERARDRILDRVKRYPGELSDAGPDASLNRLCVLSSGTRTCVSTMHMSFGGELVPRSPMTPEFQSLWLDVCMEANALDSGDPGVALNSLDALFGK